MKPYGQERKIKGSGNWKKDYHIHHSNKKVGNWWEDMCTIIPRKTMKQKLNLYLILLILILFSSCVTQKKCVKRYPPETIRVRYDSIVIKDTTIYKDRLVPYAVKADTVYKDKLILVPIALNVPPLIAENDYAKAKAWIQDSKLKLQLEQKDQVVQFKLDSADKEVRHWKYQYRLESEKQTTVIREKFIPRIYKTALFIVIGELIALIIYMYVKLKGGGLKAALKSY